MNFLKSFLFFIFLFSFLEAKDIKPTFIYNSKGGVTDIVYKNDKIYVATVASSVDIFDLNTQNKIESITIPKIKDFVGDEIDSKIYSVDILEDSILILSQGNKGGRAINIYKDGKLKEVISDKKRMFIAKAKFLDENTIIFALLSNEIFVFDLVKNKILKIEQASFSKFSNFVLTEDKKSIIIADESGDLQLRDSRGLKLIKTFKGQNLDNVFQVDTKNGIILTAGQDRRSVVYDIDLGAKYYKSAPFLIYSAGLSPSSKLAAYASNEQNDVTVFDTQTKADLHTLVQNPATITNILFINDKEVFVTSDHEKINYYKID